MAHSAPKNSTLDDDQFSHPRQGPKELLHLAGSPWLSHCLLAAIDLSLAETLAECPLPPAELARQTGTSPEALNRLLRVLSAFRVTEHLPDSRVALGDLGVYLHSGHDRSLAKLLRLYTSQHYQQAWQNLADTLRTGRAAFEEKERLDRWDYYDKYDKEGRMFDEAMAEWAQVFHWEAVSEFDFSSCSSVADVGGGSGALLAKILLHYPALRATLLDRRGPVTRASQRIAECGIADRVELREGDYFSDIPRKADVYIYAHVLIDWDDERAEEILQVCRERMPPTSTLLIVEEMIPAELTTMPFASLLDVHLMLMGPGKVRHASEIKSMVRRSGFSVEEEVATSCAVRMITARPD